VAPRVGVAAHRPAGQREDHDLVTGGAVGRERGADADLDVVGVGPDREHDVARAGRRPARLPRGGERDHPLQQRRGGHGFDEELVGVPPQRLDGVVDGRERRHDGHGDTGGT